MLADTGDVVHLFLFTESRGSINVHVRRCSTQTTQKIQILLKFWICKNPPFKIFMNVAISNCSIFL